MSNWATEKYVISDPAAPGEFGNEDSEELEKGSNH